LLANGVSITSAALRHPRNEGFPSHWRKESTAGTLVSQQMSGCGLRLVLAAAGAAGLVGLLAPPLAVGQETGAPASPETVEGTVLTETQDTVQYVPDRLVVGFEETASSAEASALIEDVDGTVKRSLPAIDASVIEVQDGKASEAIASLEAAPAVEYVELEVLLQAADVSPNDSLWSEQWGPKLVRAPAAWEATRGSASVVVAVLDTGVDAGHPDLTGALVPGFDLVNNDTNPNDDNGHGTAVAGVIAARTNNVQGEAGVCWNCAIMPVKVLGASGSGTTSAIASGILWAVAHGADVINLSLGSTGTTTALADAVAQAESEGVVVVAAAGNNGNTTRFYPAAYPQVISVAGTDSSDARYGWSNYGSWVQVAAPGCNVAPGAGGGYVNFCGTSSATPVVSGIAGLAYSMEPALSKTSFENALRSTGVQVGSAVQYGRVNAVATLEALGLTPPLNEARPSIVGTPRVASVLEARKGRWSGAPTSFSYRWQRCNTAGRTCSTIDGATAVSYRVTRKDVRSTLRVKVKARNANGASTARSAPTRAIVAAAPRAASTTVASAESDAAPSAGASSPPQDAPPPEGGGTEPPPPPPPTPIDTVTSEVQAVVEEVEQTVPATN
jgi:subtilisin family serine protease